MMVRLILSKSVTGIRYYDNFGVALFW